MEPEKIYEIQQIWKIYPEEMAKLLEDHTTHKNIIWATDSYASHGEGYTFHDTIEIPLITGDNAGMICPRAKKNREEQDRRVKDKAEVFTPSWICNAQNNLIDDAWFGRENVFNREVTLDDGTHTWIPVEGKIDFPDEKGKSWRDYVRDIRLEITCGEAPYLVSRFDAVTGIPIPLHMRIGLLDRKMRVVSENVDDRKEWLKWARTALECTYGYEWQGDSLLLARENILLSMFDYFQDKFSGRPGKDSVKGWVYRISWNLWQMDGLKYVIPGSCQRQPVKAEEKRYDTFQFEEFEEDNVSPEIESKPKYKECDACKTGKGPHIGKKAYIRDWKVFNRINKSRVKTDKENSEDKKIYNIPFIQVVNNPYRQKNTNLSYEE